MPATYQAEWVPGLCWRCEATDRPVLWLGPVHTRYGTSPFYACEACIARLEDLVFAEGQQIHIK